MTQAFKPGFYLCALSLLSPCAAQPPTAAPTPAQIVDRAAPAVAMVLAVQSTGEAAPAVGAALVIYQDGDLLTPYHLIRNATAVQVRFKSGEVFDRVQLLGVDARRDVAAIRITASGLPIIPIARGVNPSPGDAVESIFHLAAQPWSSSTGVVAGFKLADEIPGAGTGFRVIQFTAPAASGSSGGILIDAEGRALGLITGPLSGGQNLNLAVPIESVLGLADTAPVKTFSSGPDLPPPGPGAPPVTAAPAATVPAREPAPIAPAAPEKAGKTGTTEDPAVLLRGFKTMYVDAGKANYIGSDQMKVALFRNKEFTHLGIQIVDDPKAADTVLTVGYVFAWDYPFQLKHQKTSIVLLVGKGYGPFSGLAGSASVASQFVKLVSPYRTAQPEQK